MDFEQTQTGNITHFITASSLPCFFLTLVPFPQNWFVLQLSKLHDGDKCAQTQTPIQQLYCLFIKFSYNLAYHNEEMLNQKSIIAFFI
jgi:hypothetical protein